MLKKLLKLLIITAILGGFYFLHFYVPRVITEIKLPPIEEQMKKLRPQNLPSFKEVQPIGKHIEFVSEDGYYQSAYLSFSHIPKAKGTIILLHGIRSNNKQFLNTCADLAKEGYNAVALDLRAHGNSEGVHCTFGVREKDDISLLIDYLQENHTVSDNFGIWGMSLGGAVGLQAMAKDKRIKFGIIESTFSEFRTISHDYFENSLGFNFKPFTDYLINRAGNIAEFNPEEACPVCVATQITQPILVFHGTADKNIDITYGQKNFEAISSIDKTWVPILNGKHNGMASADSETYNRALSTFLRKISKSS